MNRRFRGGQIAEYKLGALDFRCITPHLKHILTQELILLSGSSGGRGVGQPADPGPAFFQSDVIFQHIVLAGFHLSSATRSARSPKSSTHRPLENRLAW